MHNNLLATFYKYNFQIENENHNKMKSLTFFNG